MPDPSEHVKLLLTTANRELDDWHTFEETDPPLEKRIRQYCTDLGFEQPGDITRFAWSATFISWCYLKAGATREEFRFHSRHAAFVKAFIANADAGQGDFRAHSVADYAPRLGDLIHNNREGGNVTYDDARERDSYPSHTGIVVDFLERGGVRFAATIGGNESQSIRRHDVELTPEGLVKQRDMNPYISVVENLKEVVEILGPSPVSVVAAVPDLHPLLANDPVLRRAAAGELVLRPNGQLTAGVGAVHDALEDPVWRDHPEYTIDLGPNRRHRGFYGNQTARSIREFQLDNGLSQTGEIDSQTLVWLSRALRELQFEEELNEEIASTGEIVFTLRTEGRNWFATPSGGKEFFVGTSVRFGPPQSSKERRGLMNAGHKEYEHYYDPESGEAQALGHWRYVLAPTVLCESGGMFSCVNSYDRAHFTFGLYQFAAHVPNGDFVRWLRALLRQVDSAPQYFSDLTLNEQGHITRRIGSELRDLEVATDGQTRELMRYLNPSDEAVEEREVLNAARFIHWSETAEEVRRLHLLEGVRTAREKLLQQNRARPFKQTLHPDPLDALCVAIIDILHHEGSKFEKIDEVLKSEQSEKKALGALCNAGVDPNRNKKLLKAITDLLSSGKLGIQHYSELKI